MTQYLRIHKLLKSTYANGPGNRYGIWVQGCSIRCPGCINLETHSFLEGFWISVEALITRILEQEHLIEGVTVSGGEPFDQAHSLLVFLRELKNRTDLGIILYSGYNYKELEKKSHFDLICKYIDLLISGRFIIEEKNPRGLRGSSNQKYHFHSNRYTLKEIENTPIAELIIQDGEIITTGIETSLFRRLIK